MNVTKDHVGERVLIDLNPELEHEEIREAIIREVSPSGKYFRVDDDVWYSAEKHLIIEVLPTRPKFATVS